MVMQPLNPPDRIPPELDRWNWGAFLLTWIWGLGNSVFIALLALIPLVNIVMMFRMPLLAAEANGSDPWRMETTRAVAEKAAATLEGMMAAQMALTSSLWSFWPEVISGKVPSLMNGRTLRIASDAALKPAARRVKANFRRLSAKV